MKLSLCMIVKNEELFIRQCLDSVKEIADEIIIIDTGSSDKTNEIAQEFTNNIFKFEWENNFSAARNFSIRKATGDWILILDADEIFEKISKEKISNYLLFLPDDVYGLELNIINIFEDNNSNKIPNETVTRLFKNDPGIFFERSIHESVNCRIAYLKKTIYKSPFNIFHYGYLKNINNLKKSKNYIEAILSEISKNPLDWQYYGFAAIEYDKLNDFDNEEKMLLKALEISNGLYDFIFKLGVFYGARKKDYTKALKYFLKLEKAAINQYDVFANIAICYSEMRDIENVQLYIKKIIKLNGNTLQTLKFGISIFKKLNIPSKIIYFLNKLMDIEKKAEYYSELAVRYIECKNELKAAVVVAEGLNIFSDDAKLIELNLKLISNCPQTPKIENFV